MRLALILAIFACSCATTTEVPSSPKLAADYHPMAIGDHWRYRFTKPGAGSMMRDIEIVEEQGGYFLSSAGNRYQKTGNKVRDGARVILSGPIEVGTSWKYIGGASDVEHYEIVSITATVDVEAGIYKNCVQVKIEQDIVGPQGQHGILRGLMSYAKGVGPVSFSQSLETEDATRPLMSFALVRFWAHEQ